MLKRVCYFLMGSVTVIQNQIFFPNDLPFSVVVGEFLLRPIDFVSMTLLFLIGLFLFSQSFRYILLQFYLVFLRKKMFSGKDSIELVMMAGIIAGLFQFRFWLSFITLSTAFVYSLLFLNLRVEKEIFDEAGREE